MKHIFELRAVCCRSAGRAKKFDDRAWRCRWVISLGLMTPWLSIDVEGCTTKEKNPSTPLKVVFDLFTISKAVYNNIRIEKK